MTEEQMHLPQPEFKFAFQGPGLSISLTTTNPEILTQYVSVTFGATLPATTQEQFNEPAVATPKPQTEAPKQTRSRAKEKVEEPKKEEPKPEPAAEKTEPAASAPTPLQGTEEFVGASLTKDQLVEMTVACFGKDRAKVAELLGKFGAKRFSELPENKLVEYATSLTILAKELKV
jgi:hypothetical protein